MYLEYHGELTDRALREAAQLEKTDFAIETISFISLFMSGRTKRSE